MTDALMYTDTNGDAHVVGVMSDVVNNLTSTSTTSALSAYQGKVLNEKVTPLLKNVSNRTTYGFPKYRSEVSGDNNKWTAPANGTAFIQVMFDSNNYSQIQILLNSKSVTNGMLTSNGKNLEDVSVMVTVPVQKNDVLAVDFYLNFGVKKCDMSFLS